MRIVFFGSSDFSINSLDILIEKHEVVAVYTQPDRKKGRSLALSMTPVKIAALDKDIPVFQPEKISADNIIEQLKSFNADLFVVVSYGQKLSNQVLDIPKYFCLNVHASLLPKWRGASPINHAIINGDTLSGVTIMKMNEYMDGGDILLSSSIEIGDDNSVVLLHKLAVLGGVTLIQAIKKIETEQIEFAVQDEDKVTLAKKLKKEQGRINWGENAVCIANKVKGLLPWPCAFTYYKGKLLKILKAKAVNYDRQTDCSNIPGEVISIEKHAGIVVKTGGQALMIEVLQQEGKKEMNAYDFVNGHNIRIGDVLGK